MDVDPWELDILFNVFRDWQLYFGFLAWFIELEIGLTWVLFGQLNWVVKVLLLNLCSRLTPLQILITAKDTVATFASYGLHFGLLFMYFIFDFLFYFFDDSEASIGGQDRFTQRFKGVTWTLLGNCNRFLRLFTIKTLICFHRDPVLLFPYHKWLGRRWNFIFAMSIFLIAGSRIRRESTNTSGAKRLFICDELQMAVDVADSLTSSFEAISPKLWLLFLGLQQPSLLLFLTIGLRRFNRIVFESQL